MAEYINREELLESIRNGVGTDLQKLFAALCVRTAKNTDVVDVVRCKDCKNRDTEGCPFMVLDCGELVGETEDNDFCSKGERREK